MRRLIRELGLKTKIRKRFKVTPEAAIRFRWPKFSWSQFRYQLAQPGLNGRYQLWLAPWSLAAAGWGTWFFYLIRSLPGPWTPWRWQIGTGNLHRGASSSGPRKPLFLLWLLKTAKSVQKVASMSRRLNFWDNTPTERLFRRIKSVWLSGYRFISRRLP